MNRNLIISEITNTKKYIKELRSTMDRIMAGGASVLKSTEEKNKLKRGLSLVSHSAIYNMQPHQASDQFRYWVSSNQHNHKDMLKFFNIVNENKLVKQGNKLLLDRIETNMRIYVPMLTPKLNMQEQYNYDDMTDEKFQSLIDSGTKEVLNAEIDSKFHTTEADFNPSTHVKIRLLHN